jgi:ADP-heptose:LPS heptosyltransferase
LLKYSERTIIAARVLERILSLFKPIFLRATPKGSRPVIAPVIVLIEPFHMGDALSLAVMIDPLREHFPGAKVLIWCNTSNSQIYQNDSRIYKTLHGPFPWSGRASKRGTISKWLAVLRSCWEMRTHRPDIAIDTRGDIRSQALMLLAGCPQRIGYSTYVASNMRLRGLLLSHPLDDPAVQHRYLRNLNTLKPLLGIVPELRLPALPVERVQALADEGSTIVLHPGAGWVFRRWDLARWAALIGRLQQLPGVRMVLVAGPDEKELCKKLSELLVSPIEIIETTFQGLLETIAGASLFIGLDSGPMHSAVLMNVPVVALFGPGESNLWRPLSEGSETFHHIGDYPCHPCTQKLCVRPLDSCMTRIEVEEVFQAAVRVLESSPSCHTSSLQSLELSTVALSASILS